MYIYNMCVFLVSDHGIAHASSLPETARCPSVSCYLSSKIGNSRAPAQIKQSKILGRSSGSYQSVHLLLYIKRMGVAEIFAIKLCLHSIDDLDGLRVQLRSLVLDHLLWSSAFQVQRIYSCTF